MILLPIFHSVQLPPWACEAFLSDVLGAVLSPCVTLWRARFDIGAFDSTEAGPALAQAGLARAPRKRQAEFWAGRVLARVALGISPLPRGADGAPIWPFGRTGSISHGGDRVMLLAGNEARRLGVDVERLLSPLALRSTLARVVTPGERRWLDALGEEDRRRSATVVFSAKETLFKALHSEIEGKPGFTVSEVTGPPRQGKPLAVRLVRPLAPGLPAGARFAVGHAWMDGQAVTWIDQPRDGITRPPVRSGNGP